MRGLSRLALQNFRCHPELELVLSDASWVVLSGGNGTGKTSILEAIFAACRGRSFRTVAAGEMIRTSCSEARVALAGGEPRHQLNAGFSGVGRHLCLDGSGTAGLAEIAAVFAVEYVSGDVYGLLTGAPGDRRRFLDWALFHVEPRFLAVWRTWYRAHRQRNRLLRSSRSGKLTPWTAAVAEWGEELTGMRAAFVESLSRYAQENAGALFDEADMVLGFSRGWREESLAASLAGSAERERRAGRAVVGPQYDDWGLTVAGKPAKLLSRGQAKLAGFFLVRARAELMQREGLAPILLVDDFVADLDTQNVQMAIELLKDASPQIWLSMMDEAGGLPLLPNAEMFHVEPGRVRRLPCDAKG